METVTIKIPKGLPDDLIRKKIAAFEISLQEEAKRKQLLEDEKDLDEKMLNDTVRSVLRDSEVRKKLNHVDKALKDKGV